MHVVSAAILRGGRILLQQRKPPRDYPMLWETPGGKVESHDRSPRRALIRELYEELNWGYNPEHQNNSGIVDSAPLFSVAFEPPAVAKEFRMTFFQVTPWPWWEPEMRDAAGIGWFTWAEARLMNMTPGTKRFVNSVRFWDPKELRDT